MPWPYCMLAHPPEVLDDTVPDVVHTNYPWTHKSLNTPPSVAPMISGLLLIRWPWPSLFWFLAITSFAVLLVTVVFLPETCRAVVGNGSHLSPPWNKAIIQILNPKVPEPHEKSQLKREAHPKFTNPFSGLALLRHRATLVVSTCFGIYYMVHTCLQASLSTIFVDVYGVSGLVAGLVYIPFGVGCMISSFVAGMRDCFTLSVASLHILPKLINGKQRRTDCQPGLPGSGQSKRGGGRPAER